MLKSKNSKIKNAPENWREFLNEEKFVGPLAPEESEVEPVGPSDPDWVNLSPVDPEKIGGPMTTLPRQTTATQYGTLPQIDYDADAPPMGQLDIEKQLADKKAAHDIKMQSGEERIEAEKEHETEIESYDELDPKTGAPLQKQLQSTEYGVAPGTLAPFAAYTPESGVRLLKPARAYPTAGTVRTLDHIASKSGGLVVGDIAKKGGGKISGHGSHQEGTDVDFAYALTPDAGGSSHNEPGGPEYGKHKQFRSVGVDDLDMDKTWKQLRAMADPAPGGNVPAVKFAFVDEKFIDHFKKKGYREYLKFKKKTGVTSQEITTERDAYKALFGVDPETRKKVRTTDGGYRIVRHEPNHDDHVHIRMRENIQPEKDLIKEIVNKIINQLTNISN